MKEKTFSVRQYIGYQAIADVLFSGAEGCRYWANADDLAYEQDVMDMLADKEPITIADHENDGQVETLTLAKLKKGLQVLAKKYPETWSDILSENYDMYTADSLVQCALFGDIIYS